MNISYAIPVKDELNEIMGLIDWLLEHKRPQDDIIILFDSKNGSEGVEAFLRAKSINQEFLWVAREFNNNFADHKNYLNSLCKGDYIFQIDADEVPSLELLSNLPTILEQNSNVDLFLVPRVNKVEGITPQHINKWGWQQNEKGWINWPDFQSRIYRNSPEIKWTNRVHERIEGYKEYVILPTDPDYALFHVKKIDRQEKQNEYYNTI